MTLADSLATLDDRRAAGEITSAAHRAAVLERLAAPPASGHWVRGFFDGHLRADPEVEGAENPALRLELLGGVLSDTTLVEAPPAPALADRAFLWDRLVDAVVLPPSGEPGTSLTLMDLRLSEITVLGREDPFLRIQGTLHARLDSHGGGDPPPPAVDAAPSMQDLVHVVTDPHPTGEGGLTSQQAGRGCLLAVLGGLGVPLGLAVVLAVVSLSGPWAAVAWAAGIGLAARARRLVPAPVEGRPGCLGSLGLVALSGVLVAGFVAWLGAAPCEARPVGWLAALAVPVLGCAGVRSRLPFVLTTLLWSFGVWLWSATPVGTCLAGVEGRGPVALSWQETADRYAEARVHDPLADLLQAATAQSAEPRVSLDSALREPQPWVESCRLPIHLSSEHLFATGSSTLAPEAEPYLRRLARLLRAHPDTRARIEGHEPAAAEDELALTRSQIRATAVVSWLGSTGGVAPERLEARGLGGRHPVVQDPELAHYNRRLDILRSCDGS